VACLSTVRLPWLLPITRCRSVKQVSTCLIGDAWLIGSRCRSPATRTCRAFASKISTKLQHMEFIHCSSAALQELQDSPVETSDTSVAAVNTFYRLQLVVRCVQFIDQEGRSAPRFDFYVDWGRIQLFNWWTVIVRPEPTPLKRHGTVKPMFVAEFAIAPAMCFNSFLPRSDFQGWAPQPRLGTSYLPGTPHGTMSRTRRHAPDFGGALPSWVIPIARFAMGKGMSGGFRLHPWATCVLVYIHVSRRPIS
jgi:hypothetical protein